MQHMNLTPHRTPSSVAFLVLIVLGAFLAVLTPAIAADYPPGEPPETVEYGDTGTVIDYELTIVNVDEDAEEILHAFDPSMDAASDMVWVMIQIEATYTGDLVGYPADDLDYSISDTDGNTYDIFSHACPAWPFPPDGTILQPGESARFNLCFQVPYWMMTDDGTETVANTDESIELIVYTNILTDQWPVTFALDKPETDDLPLPCGCAPPPPCACAEPSRDGELT